MYQLDGSYLIQDMRQYEEGQRLRTEMNHDGVFYFYDYDRNGNRVMSLCRTSEGECYIQKKYIMKTADHCPIYAIHIRCRTKRTVINGWEYFYFEMEQ